MNVEPIWFMVVTVAIIAFFGLTMIKLEERKEKPSH